MQRSGMMWLASPSMPPWHNLCCYVAGAGTTPHVYFVMSIAGCNKITKRVSYISERGTAKIDMELTGVSGGTFSFGNIDRAWATYIPSLVYIAPGVKRFACAGLTKIKFYGFLLEVCAHPFFVKNKLSMHSIHSPVCPV